MGPHSSAPEVTESPWPKRCRSSHSGYKPLLQAKRQGLQRSSIDLGQSSFNSLDNDRSARSFPPVWHLAQ